MKIFKDSMPLFSVAIIILGQLIGFMAFNKEYPQGLKDLIIYMDISLILLLVFLFITKVMKKKNKIINLVFIPLIAGFAIYSMWSFRNTTDIAQCVIIVYLMVVIISCKILLFKYKIV